MDLQSTDREKGEKVKIVNQVKHIPKDAQVVMSILKELGATDYEPRVINQLLEFTYRYVTCILDDAKIYANHARKKVIEMDDVKLATQMILDKAFTRPPPRDVLLEIARVRNATPLPLIKTHCGLRLPPDRYCLSACNYKLRAAQQPKRMNKSALEGRSSLKSAKAASGGAGADGLGTGGGVKRPSVQSTPKTQVVSIPKPVFKFSTAPKTTPTTATKSIKTTVTSIGGLGGSNGASAGSAGVAGNVDIKMETDDQFGEANNGNKRKREEDDFEIVE